MVSMEEEDPACKEFTISNLELSLEMCMSLAELSLKQCDVLKTT